MNVWKNSSRLAAVVVPGLPGQPATTEGEASQERGQSQGQGGGD